MTGPSAATTTWLAIMRAGRWHLAVPIALALLAVGISQQSEAIAIPTVDWLVRAPILVTLVATSAGLLPLYSRFHRLDQTLVRESRGRVVTWMATAAVIGIGSLPALRIPGIGPLVCILIAVGTLGVVLVGEYAWLVGLTIGIASIFMDGSIDRPVTRLLTSVPLPIWLATAAAAGAVFWRFGPLEARRS